jgi:hypothetical protein
MPINFWDQWDRENPDGSTTTEYHAWVSEASARPPRSRTADASAGAAGEWHGGTSLPGGPQDPPEYRGRQEPSGPRETGGLPEATRTQSTEPASAGFDQYDPPPGTQLNCQEEEMAMSDGVRLSGRDQRGRMWNAHLWLPQGEEENGGPRVEPEMAAAADRALRMLDIVDQEHCAGLGLLQRRLNEHYARR